MNNEIIYINVKYDYIALCTYLYVIFYAFIFCPFLNKLLINKCAQANKQA
uniref:DNA repair protein (RAD18) n=1 Tax=Saccharomyces cerevisiae TaxID=4932 RepID=E9P9W8_YEASX|nr:ORF (gtg start codon) [Saccharomyces cerevisiae]